MLYVVLLLLLTCGVYIEWSLNGFEIVSPVSLMLLGLALSDVLAMVGRGSWNNEDLSFHAFLIIAVGSAALLLGSFLAHGTRAPFSSRGWSGMLPKVAQVALWKYMVLMLLVLVAIILRVSDTYRLASELGVDASSYSAAAKAVRGATSSIYTSNGIKFGSGFSFITRQFMKVASCISYLAAYLLASEIMGRRKVGVVASIALIAECWLYVFSSNGRGDILYQVIVFAVSLFILALRRGYSAKALTVKYLVAGTAAGIILAVAFWGSGKLVGRNSSFAFLEYISFYYGGGIPSLQSILEAGTLAELTPGIRSFYYLFAAPYKMGLISEYPSYSLAWIMLGNFTSNIFTGFARYYLDFGWLGLIILSFAAAYIMTRVYRYSKTSGACFVVVMTGYFAAYAFDFAREEFIFSRFLAMSSVFWLFILLVLVLFMTTDLRELRNCIAGRIKKKQD